MTPRQRVLLLGVTGFLGWHVAEALADQCDLVAPRPRRGPIPQGFPGRWLTARLEATNLETLQQVLEEAAPNSIVNMIAITPRSSLANDPVACISVNSLFPQQLAYLAHKAGCYLVHVSSDGVFSGRHGPYRETDTPDPVDLYGRTKWLGEIAKDHVLTVRTSVFGLSRDGSGLVDWLLQQEGRTVQGFRRALFSGLCAPALARTMAKVMVCVPRLTGLYHIGGSSISKHDLLVRLADAFRLQVTIEPVDAPVINRSLDSTRFWTDLKSTPPTIESMVAELAARRAAHRS